MGKDERMDRQKRVYRITQIVFAVSGAVITVYNFLYCKTSDVLLGLVTFLFLFVPPVAERVLRLRLGERIKSLILIFSMFAFNFGTALHAYNHLDLYDLVMHALSGVLFTFIGLCFYARLRKTPVDKANEWFLQLSYAFFFSMFVAVIWEIYEYMCFTLFAHDAQNHLTTGVVDTMEDIAACFIGSAGVAISFIIYAKKDKRSYLVRAYEEFAALNTAEPEHPAVVPQTEERGGI